MDWLETGLIVLLFLVVAGAAPPGVNEPHYLGKAKHYWQSDWCRGDFFFESPGAHTAFFWIFGWVTKYVTLPTAAWTGRLVVWLLLARSWQTLISRLSPITWAPLGSATVLVAAQYGLHLSGEWLVGGVEGKGFAYPLVFWAVAGVVERQWWKVWPLLGIASCFHVLVGGWSVIACLLAWTWRRKEDELSLPDLAFWLVVGGLLALPGLIPALQMTQSATVDVEEASRIYTFRRLKHHLVFQEFAWWNMVRFALLGIACWKVADLVPPSPRAKRFWTVVLGALSITTAGILVDFATGPFPGLRASLLRFYWFRIGDVLLPAGMAVGLLLTLHLVRSQRPRWLGATSLVLVLWISGDAIRNIGLGARPLSLQQQIWNGMSDRDLQRVDDDWIDACVWVRENAPADSIFLTPRRQQTFKWYAFRPSVATWKDVPQDADGLVEWWQRQKDVYAASDWPWNNAQALQNLMTRYGVTHVIWPLQKGADLPAEGVCLYRNHSFFVQELVRPEG